MKNEAECLDMLHKKCDDCKDSSCLDCFVLTEIDALVKRIPMKPVEQKIYKCPICDEPLRIRSWGGEKLTREVTYCDACGQAIEWKGIDR